MATAFETVSVSVPEPAETQRATIFSLPFRNEDTVIAFTVGLSIAAQSFATLAGVVSRGGSGVAVTVGVAVGEVVGTGVGSEPSSFLTTTEPFISVGCVEHTNV